MTDEEIVLYFNEHRLAKLESYLLKDGSSVEHELQNLLDRFYEQIVPEHERMEVEAQIELEREREAAQREASRRFAVVHFHEGDDDFFFTSELRNSFYSIANLYRSTLKDEVGKIYAGQYCAVELQRMPDDQRYDVLRSVQRYAK